MAITASDLPKKKKKVVTEELPAVQKGSVENVDYSNGKPGTTTYKNPSGETISPPSTEASLENANKFLENNATQNPRSGDVGSMPQGGFNPSQRGGTIKDRQELANARARKAGIEPLDLKSTMGPETTPQEIALANKQSAELKAIDEIKNNKPQLSVTDRNTQAGLAAVNAISQTFGGEAVPLDVAQSRLGVPQIEQPILTVLGKIVDFRAFDFSISDVFSKSNQGNIANLENDAADMLAEATRISRKATTQGANIQQSITSMQVLEEGIRSRYADAQISLSASPKDVAAGLDLTDSLSYKLRAITEQRQALERYQMTGNVKEVLSMVGTQTTE